MSCGRLRACGVKTALAYMAQMQIWRSYLAVAMALCLAVSALGSVQAAPAQEGVILCTGEGAVTVYLDANGEPVPAPYQHCPECVLHVVATLETRQTLKIFRPCLGEIERGHFSVRTYKGDRNAVQQARAPPVYALI